MTYLDFSSPLRLFERLLDEYRQSEETVTRSFYAGARQRIIESSAPLPERTADLAELAFEEQQDLEDLDRQCKQRLLTFRESLRQDYASSVPSRVTPHGMEADSMGSPELPRAAPSSTSSAGHTASQR
jgi:hypothetical protein